MQEEHLQLSSTESTLASTECCVSPHDDRPLLNAEEEEVRSENDADMLKDGTSSERKRTELMKRRVPGWLEDDTDLMGWLRSAGNVPTEAVNLLTAFVEWQCTFGNSLIYRVCGTVFVV